MKILYMIALCLILVGCDKFDRDNLLKSSFVADLDSDILTACWDEPMQKNTKKQNKPDMATPNQPSD